MSNENLFPLVAANGILILILYGMLMSLSSRLKSDYKDLRQSIEELESHVLNIQNVFESYVFMIPRDYEVTDLHRDYEIKNGRIEGERRFTEGERRFTEGERRFTEGERRFTEGERRFTEGERRFTEGERRFTEGERRFDPKKVPGKFDELFGIDDLKTKKE